MTTEEIQKIALAEFAYWRDADAVQRGTSKGEMDQSFIHLGAMAAAANIVAAINGRPAAWHRAALMPAPTEAKKS